MNYSISESEWKIMRVLWDNPPMPLGELIALVGLENNWNGNTVRTLLVRLVEKGAVKAEKQGRNYLYSALAQENECVMQETEHPKANLRRFPCPLVCGAQRRGKAKRAGLSGN